MPRTKKDEALVRLKRIEDKIDRSDQKALVLWTTTVGIALIIYAYGITEQKPTQAFIIILLAVVIALLPWLILLIIPSKKKKKP